MPDVRLLKDHRHDGKDNKVGEVISVDTVVANWLIAQQIAELVEKNKSDNVKV